MITQDEMPSLVNDCSLLVTTTENGAEKMHVNIGTAQGDIPCSWGQVTRNSAVLGIG